MSALVERMKLPFPTDATETGPIIEYRNSSVSVKYDNLDSKEAKWVSLAFRDVLAYEVCESICCSVETVIPSDVIEARKESAWLTQIVGRWKELVGWQQFQQELGGEKRFKHYVIDFDDVCAVQVIAAACTVQSDE